MLLLLLLGVMTLELAQSQFDVLELLLHQHTYVHGKKKGSRYLLRAARSLLRCAFLEGYCTDGAL